MVKRPDKLAVQALQFVKLCRERTLLCVLVGCTPSWTLGAQFGNRPICAECKRELSKDDLRK